MTRVDKVTCIATALLLFFNCCEAPAASPHDYSESLSLAIDRWLAVQEPSGLMPYGYDFIADEASEPATLSAPNLTRQAGTAAALADYYALTKDQRIAPAIARYLQAFERYSLPIGKHRLQTLLEQTRLLSLPIGRYKLTAALKHLGLLYETTGPGKVLSPDEDYSKAYTGAVALALLTELRYSATSKDDSFAGLRHAWLEGLIGLRIPGDGFRMFPTSIDATPYFDGESWLALAQYRRTFPQDREVSELLSGVDTALMEKYGAAFSNEFYHWGTMAAAVRFMDTKGKPLLGFIKAQTQTFLDKQKETNSHNTCASVEGVADALTVLRVAGEDDSELAQRAREWVAVEMTKARQLQIQPGQKELVFPNARIIAPRMQEFSGSFRSGVHAAKTQVDLTAHCVSAMIKLQRYAATPLDG